MTKSVKLHREIGALTLFFLQETNPERFYIINTQEEFHYEEQF